MTYSAKQIEEAVSTVHMNSRRQAKRNITTSYAGGDINFIGTHAFAYGTETQLLTNWGETTLLEFMNGPNYLDALFQWDGAYYASTSDTRTMLYLNEDRISDRYFTVEYINNGAGPLTTPIIIPPFSKIRMVGATQDSGTPPGTDRMIGRMTAKVYSGAEVIQGAI